MENKTARPIDSNILKEWAEENMKCEKILGGEKEVKVYEKLIRRIDNNPVFTGKIDSDFANFTMIDCKDKKPEKGQTVLAYGRPSMYPQTQKHFCIVTDYFNEFGYVIDFDLWLPLPNV